MIVPGALRSGCSFSDLTDSVDPVPVEVWNLMSNAMTIATMIVIPGYQESPFIPPLWGNLSVVHTILLCDYIPGPSIAHLYKKSQ